MNKMLVFDAGPVISLTTNNLLWLLPKLKQQFQGDFCIPLAVKSELVDRPFVTKKFKFEAIQVEQQIESKTITVLKDDRIRVDGERLQEIANSIFIASNQAIAIVQKGEMQSLAASILFDADAFLTDERITRLLLESPDGLKQLLEKRLHSKIKINDAALYELKQKVRHVRIIRSVELVLIAYEFGVLDKFIVALPNSRKELLESVLWGVKLHGCAISEQEINQIVKLEMRK